MIKYIILLSVLFFNFNSFSQDKPKDMFDIIINDAEIFFLDGFSFYTYPLRMNESELIVTAGLGVGTYFMLDNDDNLRSKFGVEVEKYDNNFWKLFEYYGVVEYAEIAGAATYGVGLLTSNTEVRTVGRMIVQSLTYSGLTAMMIRMITGRKRPPYSDDPVNFIGFTTNNDYQSFPSGHVTVAFALSTVLAEYFDSPLSRLGFYGIASLSAIERLINSQHWFTDVALGALLGIAGGIHVINEEYKRNNHIQNRISIRPTLNGISLQISLN
ncbi:MAG: phosphatase PAP2 family protein [Melioribacteraceae bacterium]|nr:phosphatase PAP2 family protein [Melioribacteraceae bacterium]